MIEECTSSLVVLSISLEKLGGLMTTATGDPGIVEEEVETAVLSQGAEAVSLSWAL
jgi:hypothetical protein